MDLRYGINPEQAARASVGETGSPVRVVSGEPSYINLLDASMRGSSCVRRPRRSVNRWRRRSSTSRQQGPPRQARSTG